jgi:uncharacterized membrane protein
MDAKRTVAAVLVGAAVLYGVGWLLFDKLLLNFYMANAGSATGVMRENQVLWSLVVGYLFYAYLIVYALRFRSGAGSISQGFLIGASVGFLVWASVDFIFYGIANINNLTLTIVDPLVELIHGGIAGAAIAAVRGGGGSPAA